MTLRGSIQHPKFYEHVFVYFDQYFKLHNEDHQHVQYRVHVLFVQSAGPDFRCKPRHEFRSGRILVRIGTVALPFDLPVHVVDVPPTTVATTVATVVVVVDLGIPNVTDIMEKS